MGLDFISPVTTDARIALISGSALTLTSTGLKKQVEDPLQNYSVEHKPLGSAAKYGDLAGQLIPNAAYAAAMLGHYFITKNKKTLGYASQMIRSSLHASLLTTVLKYSVREPRPNNGNERNSFPSGHSTTVFAFASTVATNHAWYWGVPAFALAGFSGYSRITDNRHYLHDVIAGATVGISYGLGIYFRDKAKENEKQKEISPDSLDGKVKTETTFAPLFSNDLAGVFLQINF